MVALGAPDLAPLQLPRCGGTRAVGHITLSVNGRQTLIGAFPVGIAPRMLARLARSSSRSSLVKSLVASLGGRHLVIGVDRLDYSKGLILAKHSEWIGKVTYLQITPKSRSGIPEYSQLGAALGSAAGRNNGKYGEIPGRQSAT